MEEKKVSKELYDMLMIGMFSKSKPTIDNIINRAYRDMAAHTLRGIKDKNVKKDLKGKAAKKIIEAIEKLSTLDNNQDNYDQWHTQICKDVMGIYDTYYKNSDNTIRFSFGQAQKWVNMTMKYLCMVALDMDSLKNYGWVAEKWKKYLHFPMDNYILTYMCDPYPYGSSKPTDNPYEVSWTKSKVLAWSKMKKYKYDEILGVVRDFCKNENGKHTEFIKKFLFYGETEKSTYDGTPISVYEWESKAWNIEAEKRYEKDNDNKE